MNTNNIKEFLVPDLGEGLEEATVVCWNVAVGDDVELNQTLCSLETAKAEVEIPSPYAGRIVELRGSEGETLQVGSILVRIDTEPDSSPSDSPTGAAQKRTPVLVGYGADDDVDISRRSSQPPSAAPPVELPAGASRARAAPPVRKLAAELSVDLAALRPGSGAGGVITREDVLAAADTSEPQLDGADLIPVRGVQARMADRMKLSRTEIPDAHASLQADCTKLLALRDRLRAAADESRQNITPFALTLRMVVIALMHNRSLNSTWVDTPDGAYVQSHRGISIGFGVATERGLLVPVVADAQELTTRQLANRVADLIHRGREGHLKPAEMQGSTFTVSNFGALGLDDGVPVINYPEAAILGMGSLKPRPVAVDGDIAVRSTMTLTCAFDHRIADGADVAQFLCRVRDLVESPDLALLDL
ncbi:MULTISPECIES: dihydrolipoamide acetyltransferase family protein [Mycolicibacter]|uniref:Dihydrolipoamide acetyltransferase component of pyruvate dehydrogenase complex n=1 Tax=Mycolicibacter kumamotonensis TaxID=354243 RepID=A0A7K3L6V7_9MYCO|nr:MULTISPECIES: dihydrolipoamide acetyltransferase family protein [Mycolicibacter]NDJ88144.1 2-oxo acid dehydrogenase subunit E2 [Mycolicibacter kumamotonensis]RAV03845.1 2-oxo acid dehydrogenase subunit E2 [Mycolicibacter senuensis]